MLESIICTAHYLDALLSFSTITSICIIFIPLMLQLSKK